MANNYINDYQRPLEEHSHTTIYFYTSQHITNTDKLEHEYQDNKLERIITYFHIQTINIDISILLHSLT
ncbi:hypothetical protein [Ehrlichia ruminantium]|uniref:hypothetical protein n=1 Tax=Ehrlichia ruminantium TaxID=779 RepID=UPI001FC85CF1|nr:hypothetical protein [Ehrlichia ruminantium]UOD97764.1 hypothetical protein IMW64_04255 [Ehrlichia ruminantium]